MDTFIPPTPERNRQINMALVRAIQRCQARKAAAASAPSPVVEDAECICRREGLGEGLSLGDVSATNRTQLRDRLGQIITIDRADTSRSIANI